MAKLTHPSPEPTINSLRMLNVVLQKRLNREEESRNQRTSMDQKQSTSTPTPRTHSTSTRVTQ